MQYSNFIHLPESLIRLKLNKLDSDDDCNLIFYSFNPLLSDLTQ